MLKKYGVTHQSHIQKNIKKRGDKRKEGFQKIIGKDAILLDYIWNGKPVRHQDILKIQCDKCDEIHETKMCVFQQRIQLNLDWRDCITGELNGSSQGERDLRQFVIDNYNGKIIKNDRQLLTGKELDIYIPDLNLAIEFNGLYWHSEVFKDKYYHYDKWKECKDLGIDLIQIYEDEWKYKQDIVKSRILNLLGKSKVIYARKCEIRKIPFSECSVFLDNNHLQGKVNSSLNFGLYYNNELVSLMTFGRPRKGMRYKSKDNIYELYRFCNKNGYSVVGGASKLFKHFIRNYEYDEIYSYSFIEWKGGLYEKLGFELDNITKDSYWFFANDKRVSRHQFNKHNLTNMGYKNLNEAKLDLVMYEIHGAGTKRFIYK